MIVNLTKQLRSSRLARVPPPSSRRRRKEGQKALRTCNAICKKEEERKRLAKASRGLPGHVELLLFFSKREEETAEGFLRESDRPFVTGPSSWSQARSRCCTPAMVATPCTCRVRSNSIASSDFFVGAYLAEGNLRWSLLRGLRQAHALG